MAVIAGAGSTASFGAPQLPRGFVPDPRLNQLRPARDIPTLQPQRVPSFIGGPAGAASAVTRQEGFIPPIEPQPQRTQQQQQQPSTQQPPARTQQPAGLPGIQSAEFNAQMFPSLAGAFTVWDGVEGWSRAYAREHGGLRPGERPGESFTAAISNLLWSQEFARTSGRAPNEDEWRFHFYRPRDIGDKGQFRQQAREVLRELKVANRINRDERFVQGAVSGYMGLIRDAARLQGAQFPEFTDQDREQLAIVLRNADDPAARQWLEEVEQWVLETFEQVPLRNTFIRWLQNLKAYGAVPQIFLEEEEPEFAEFGQDFGQAVETEIEEPTAAPSAIPVEPAAPAAEAPAAEPVEPFIAPPPSETAPPAGLGEDELDLGF